MNVEPASNVAFYDMIHVWLWNCIRLDTADVKKNVIERTTQHMFSWADGTYSNNRWAYATTLTKVFYIGDK